MREVEALNHKFPTPHRPNSSLTTLRLAYLFPANTWMMASSLNPSTGGALPSDAPNLPQPNYDQEIDIDVKPRIALRRSIH
jgi:hypothetical protein